MELKAHPSVSIASSFSTWIDHHPYDAAKRTGRSVAIGLFRAPRAAAGVRHSTASCFITQLTRHAAFRYWVDDHAARHREVVAYPLEAALPADERCTSLRTRPPVGEEGEEVGDADIAGAVERSKKPPAGDGRRCDGCDNSARAGYGHGPQLTRIAIKSSVPYGSPHEPSKRIRSDVPRR